VISRTILPCVSSLENFTSPRNERGSSNRRRGGVGCNIAAQEKCDHFIFNINIGAFSGLKNYGLLNLAIKWVRLDVAPGISYLQNQIQLKN